MLSSIFKVFQYKPKKRTSRKYIASHRQLKQHEPNYADSLGAADTVQCFYTKFGDTFVTFCDQGELSP